MPKAATPYPGLDPHRPEPRHAAKTGATRVAPRALPHTRSNARPSAFTMRNNAARSRVARLQAAAEAARAEAVAAKEAARAAEAAARAAEAAAAKAKAEAEAMAHFAKAREEADKRWEGVPQLPITTSPNGFFNNNAEGGSRRRPRRARSCSGD
jgi:hypothetical protein